MTNTSLETQLAPVYRFLGRLWLREPDAETLVRWRSVQPLVRGADSCSDEADESWKDLQMEFCRLFIGPKDHLPPYQSVWQTGQLGGPATVSMNQYLARSGFDSCDSAQNVPADHLGLQLEFFGWMLEQHSATVESEIVEILTEYEAAHLTWADEFLRRVAAASESLFYRDLAMITHQLLINRG